MFPLPPFPLEREPTASAPRGDTLSTRIDCYRSIFMPLVRGRKESKLVRSLVLYVKLGVRFLAAVAARIPSLKLHIPCIRTLRISVCSSSARGLRRVLLIRCAPSFPNGLFSHHSNRGNSLQEYSSFAGETVGTRIDRDISLIMPLRLRGGCATECHAFSYFSSSSALKFSPPLRLVFRF